jgi:TonB-linked SusC/RagA family outer membrane protein
LSELHNLSLTGGFSYQDFSNESFAASNTGFISDSFSFWNLGAGTNPQNPGSSLTKSEIMSFYARLNYSFDNRYAITFTSRYDGASQFSEGNKWSFFPSGAVSWNMTNEKFFPKNNVLTTLKLRTSYGITGNQGISAYRSLAQMSSSFFVYNDVSVNSVHPTAIANNDLTWETTAQFDVGFDMDFLNKRISLSADYYNKQTKDLLFNVPIASFSGYTSRLANIGRVENKGFEFYLSSRNLVDKFQWNTSLNISVNRNKVLSLPGGNDIINAAISGSSGGSLDNSVLREGESVGSFYGYVYDGVYQVDDNFIPGGGFEAEAGGEKFVDVDNNGMLNTSDRTIIGNPNPKAIWGLNNDFSYKGFDMNIFFQSSVGGDVLNAVALELDRLSGISNASKNALNRWTPENTNTDIPRAYAGRAARTSTRFIEDGTYIRLKNVSLGYNIPIPVLTKLKMLSARIYVSAQNLFTITNYSGVDPEVAYNSSNTNIGIDYGSYPNVKSFTIGLNIGF